MNEVDDVDVTSIRIEALDRAVRVALASSRSESDQQTVQRAQAFEKFLLGKAPETGSSMSLNYGASSGPPLPTQQQKNSAAYVVPGNKQV